MGDIETFAKSTEKQSRSPVAYYFIKKETLIQAFSSKFWEIYKNTNFTEHLRMNAFSTILDYCWIHREAFHNDEKLRFLGKSGPNFTGVEISTQSLRQGWNNNRQSILEKVKASGDRKLC